MQRSSINFEVVHFYMSCRKMFLGWLIRRQQEPHSQSVKIIIHSVQQLKNFHHEFLFLFFNILLNYNVIKWTILHKKKTKTFQFQWERRKEIENIHLCSASTKGMWTMVKNYGNENRQLLIKNERERHFQ